MSQIFLLTFFVSTQYILMSCSYSNFIGLITTAQTWNIIQAGQALCAANVMVKPPSINITMLGER